MKKMFIVRKMSYTFYFRPLEKHGRCSDINNNNNDIKNNFNNKDIFALTIDMVLNFGYNSAFYIELLAYQLIKYDRLMIILNPNIFHLEIKFEDGIFIKIIYEFSGQYIFGLDVPYSLKSVK